MPGKPQLFADNSVDADDVFSNEKTNGKANGHINGNQSRSDSDTDSVEEKLHFLETKTKEQGSEINLLKGALADALARLTKLEEGKEINSKEKLKDKTTKPRSSHTLPAKRVASSTTTPPTTQSKQSPTRPRSKSELPLSRKSTHTEEALTKKNVKAKTSVEKRLPAKKTTSPIKRRSTTESITEIPYSHQPKKDTTEDGKPKIILANKRNITKSPKKHVRSNSGSNSGDSDGSDDAKKFYIRGRGLSFHAPTGYEEPKDNGTAPEEQLKLNFVYGYRGKDCRDNLFILPSGELLYNMAGVIVIYDSTKETQRHYTGHTDDVKCVALHPDGNTVASGQVAGHGEDGKPHILVWNATTLETITSFGHGNFERGLCATDFSKQDGKYLVAIDESNEHVVSIWEWEKQVKLTETKEKGTSQDVDVNNQCSKEIVFNVKWSSKDLFSFSTYGKSHLCFWTFDPENKSLNKKAAIYEKVDKPKFVLSLVYTEDDGIITGDSNGNILLFKEGSNRISASSNSMQKGGVFALTLLEDGTILSCGKDGQCMVWNRNCEKIKDAGKISDQYGPARCMIPSLSNNSIFIGTSKNCILKYEDDWQHERLLMQGHADEMWGLTVHPNKPTFATCSQEQTVCVWDGETSKNIWTSQIDDSAVCIEMHPTLPYVLVGTKTGSICILNYETKEELITLAVTREIINDIKMSPNAKYFAIASRDTNIYLYAWPDDVTNFKKPKTLSGHSSRVTHLDWSSDSEYIQSNSQDYELLFWHTESGLQVLSTNALKDINWETWTCTLGFPVTGIWPEGADGTDINTCCRSYNKQLVATGDDFGDVKLFRYPSTKLKAESTIGKGHSSHVTNVRFLKDDTSLITVGGNDCSIMKWSLVKE